MVSGLLGSLMVVSYVDLRWGFFWPSPGGRSEVPRSMRYCWSLQYHLRHRDLTPCFQVKGARNCVPMPLRARLESLSRFLKWFRFIVAIIWSCASFGRDWV